jgi:hypothetical protein
LKAAAYSGRHLRRNVEAGDHSRRKDSNRGGRQCRNRLVRHAGAWLSNGWAAAGDRRQREEDAESVEPNVRCGWPLASASGDHTVNLWDAAGGALPRTRSGRGVCFLGSLVIPAATRSLGRREARGVPG